MYFIRLLIFPNRYRQSCTTHVCIVKNVIEKSTRFMRQFVRICVNLFFYLSNVFIWIYFQIFKVFMLRNKTPWSHVLLIMTNEIVEIIIVYLITTWKPYRANMDLMVNMHDAACARVNGYHSNCGSLPRRGCARKSEG